MIIFNFFIISVESAVLKSTGQIVKPYPYVELSVDDFKKHRTQIFKNTYQPKWNEEVTVYVFKNNCT